MDRKLRDIVSKARKSIEPEWVSLERSVYNKLEKNGEIDQLKSRATISQLQLCEYFLGRKVGVPLVMYRDTWGMEEKRRGALRGGGVRNRYLYSEYLASGGWVNDLFPAPRDQAMEIIKGLNPLPAWRNCHGVLKMHMMLREVGTKGRSYAFTLRLPNSLALVGEGHSTGLVRLMARRLQNNFKRTSFAGRPLLFTLEYSDPLKKKNPHLHGVIPASEEEEPILRQLLRNAGTYRGRRAEKAVRLVTLRNTGWSNYFTKQHSVIKELHRHQPYHANNTLIKAAEALYDEARDLAQEAHDKATTLLAVSA